jgi:ribose 5-phosphate isomerase B
MALADEIVQVWLATAFAGGRHQRRIDQIAEIERSGYSAQKTQEETR